MISKIRKNRKPTIADFIILWQLLIHKNDELRTQHVNLFRVEIDFFQKHLVNSPCAGYLLRPRGFGLMFG